MTQVAANHPVLDPVFAPPFPQAALPVLRNPQLRKNVAHAIDVIQAKRAKLHVINVTLHHNSPGNPQAQVTFAAFLPCRLY